MEQIKIKNRSIILVSRIALLVWLIVIPIFLQAREFNQDEVRIAVETWVRYVTAEAMPDAVIERMEPFQMEKRTVAYIAHLLGGGFCLCGADDLVLPVYLYSPHGTYDPLNPHYQYILGEIGTRLNNLDKGILEREPRIQLYREALSERASFWQDLITGRTPQKMEELETQLAGLDSMSLNFTSHWHQDSPYNDQCPVLTPPDEHTPVGCVATATSQIMYYWKWPQNGVGSGNVIYYYRMRSNWDEEPLVNDPGISPNWWGGNRLKWTAGKLQMNGYWDFQLYRAAQGIKKDDINFQTALQKLWDRLTKVDATYNANFGTSNYNWSVMKDICTDPPDAGDAEVSKLCYHVGISVQTSYNITGAASGIELSGNALRNNFRYCRDAIYNFSIDQNKMVEEIQWLRPIAWEASGHAWVIYGYNKTTIPKWQFRMNMGWGGSWDNWYSCDDVPYGLNYTQRNLTAIAPLDVVKFVGDNNLGDGTPNDPYMNIEEAITKAANGATLIFKAGSVNTFSASNLIINRPFTLKGRNVTIQK